LHRRFEVVAGAQAQVDWGDEGAILLEAGIGKVYSFYMTLSYSREPFCCSVTSQDLGTFFDCHPTRSPCSKNDWVAPVPDAALTVT
jgi:transposase